MLMAKQLLLSFLLLLSAHLGAQNFTISGYVTDAETGEALIGANIFNTYDLSGTTTNVYGFYSLIVKADSVNILVSYVGYQNQKISIEKREDFAANIALTESVLLNEVSVVANKENNIVTQTQMSSVTLEMKQITSLPSFGGEPDLIKALQLLPGVQSGSEGSSGLYVRGGGPDQNLVLLDGVPLYNVQHLFGFFSVFNANAINSMKFITGGFPARYGGRLSSVLDIRMKEGNLKDWRGSVGVGLISSNALVEGPLKKDKSSIIISARRTYIDVLARPIIKSSFRKTGEDGLFGYYFYDINAKVNYKLSEKDKLYYSLYFGRDKGFTRFSDSYSYDTDVKEENEFSLGWGNVISALRWNHQYNNKLFSNVTLHFSNYDFATGYQSNYTETFPDGLVVNEDFNVDYQSLIRDFGAKIDYDWAAGGNHFVRFGANITHHQFRPGFISFANNTSLENDTTNAGASVDTTLNYNPDTAIEAFAYIEDEYTITEKLKINGGLHFSIFGVEGKTYKSLEPRMAVNYTLNKHNAFKASFALMNQYVHLLAATTLSLPTDLWVPARANIKPQRAWQAALGWAANYKGFNFSVEGYYKDMRNMLAYTPGTNIIDPSIPWYEKVSVGNGQSYGAEFLVKKDEGKLTGWIGYTLSWNWRDFPDIQEEPYLYRYDRRHDISVVAIYKLGKRVEFSATWVYGSGYRQTLAEVEYLGIKSINNNGLANTGQNIEGFDTKNNYKMADYHRLDLGVNFKKQKKRGLRTWSVNIYNTYNRKNAFFIYKDFNYTTEKPIYKQVSLFPILPSFMYTFEFNGKGDEAVRKLKKAQNGQ